MVLFIKVAVVALRAVWWGELQFGRLICCGCSLGEVLVARLVVLVMVTLLIMAVVVLLMGGAAT